MNTKPLPMHRVITHLAAAITEATGQPVDPGMFGALSRGFMPIPDDVVEFGLLSWLVEQAVPYAGHDPHLREQVDTLRTYGCGDPSRMVLADVRYAGWVAVEMAGLYAGFDQAAHDATVAVGALASYLEHGEDWDRADVAADVVRAVVQTVVAGGVVDPVVLLGGAVAEWHRLVMRAGLVHGPVPAEGFIVRPVLLIEDPDSDVVSREDVRVLEPGVSRASAMAWFEEVANSSRLERVVASLAFVEAPSDPEEEYYFWEATHARLQDVRDGAVAVLVGAPGALVAAGRGA